jgi:ribonuclease J
VSVALAVTRKGELAADPEVDLIGIPNGTATGEPLADIAFEAVMRTFESLPRARRSDPDALAESVRGAVRSAIAEHWGKKPMCYVHVLQV